MAEAIKRISADVYKRTDIPPIVVKQNDYNSRFLKVTVTNQGDVLSVPLTATVLLNAKRADGASASYIGTVNGDGTVTLPLSSWVLALFDYVDCSVSIVEGETKLSTMTFSLFVEPQENPDEVIDDDPNVPVLVELIEDVTELENQYEQLLTNKLITGVEYNPETGVTTFYFVDGYGNTSSFEIASQVSSVNGKTGVIVLDASDVGADPSGSAATVQGNLNTHANNPTIHVDAAQKQIWFSKYTKPSGGIPKTDLAAAVQASLDKADTALQNAPVISVNEQTGDVILTASDVGADESGAAATVQGHLDTHTQNTTIHTNATEKAVWGAKYDKPVTGIPKADLASDVQTSLGKADTALQSAPVSSVNSKTGAVILGAEDVGADPVGSAAAVQSNLDTANGKITVIEGLIPEAASANNQLADKQFVNSSIGTNTAYFIGTFNSLADLEAYTGVVTNNDYAFVIGTDAAGNTTYSRYKYNANTNDWVFEYVLNNSSFTAAQWDAISSGITAAKVSSYDSHVANNNIHVTSSEKAAWTAKYTKPSSGIPKNDLDTNVQASLDKADSALQSAPVTSVNTKTGAVSLSYSDVGADASGAAATVQGNLDSHTQDSTIHVTAANKTTWNAKYAKPSGGIPKSDLAEAVQTSLGKADTALQSAPVSSVNNKTGAVELTYSDVGADASGAAATVQGNLTSHADNTDIHTTANEKNAWNAKYSKPSGGIPKSDLSAGVQSSLNLADTALQAAPVSSVNGKTGAVKINRYGTVTLTTSWTQSGNWYTQTASLTGLTDDDLVSIQLDDSTIEALIADGVTCFKCDNINGTATFKALGAAPSAAITVQYELTVESAAT